MRRQSPRALFDIIPQVKRLLSALEGEMSRQDILHVLGLSDRKSLRQRHLSPALHHGYAVMTRPDAPSAKNQKYRFTPRGRRVR